MCRGDTPGALFFYSLQYNAIDFIHFILLLQIVLEKLNKKGVVYTPSKTKKTESFEECEDVGSRDNGLGRKEFMYQTSKKKDNESNEDTSEEDDAEEKAVPPEDAYCSKYEYHKKEKGTISDPWIISNNNPVASSSSEIPLFEFPIGNSDKVTQYSSEKSLSSEAMNIIYKRVSEGTPTQEVDGKRKREQSPSLKSSKRPKPDARKGNASFFPSRVQLNWYSRNY